MKLKRYVPIHKLAAHVNASELIVCRPRTKEEERAYLASLPPQKPYVDPASLVEISANKVRQIRKRMKERPGCTLARACHELGARVGQYNRAVKKMEAAK